MRHTASPAHLRMLWRIAIAAGLGALPLAFVTGETRAAAQTDVSPPTLVSRSPAVNSTGVSTQASISVTFNEPVAAASLSFTLRNASAALVPAAVTYDDATRTATLDPIDDLGGNVVHTAEVLARDVAGNAMATPAAWSFTTATPSFQQSTVFSGLTNPTVVEFASDGRVFIAEKSGIIKVFDNLGDTTASVFADLRTNVYNFHDRGLLGMALHPDFPNTPYLYVLYSHDADIGGTAPKWSTPGATSDPCPTPPGETADGCVISARLSRLTANGNTMTGPESVLVENWFQQYPSHSIGSLAFGSDGMLYASGGDGASYNFVDYGQDGNPLNPGGDPPGGVGGVQTPPTAEGGALRSQDIRSAGDPVTLDGTVIRVDPLTGAAGLDNPLNSHVDPNGRRIVAYGLRNPFRITARPGTREIWIGDVGWSTFEEINRIADPTDSEVDNFGWPCYEGAPRQSGYDGANLNLCEQLYATGAVTPPVYAYRHAQKVSTETCGTGSSSISGLAFYQAGTYPSSYRNALFFADYSRNCIWVMFADASGNPDPNTRTPFLNAAAGPVDLEIGPGGDLFYVSLTGTLRRMRYFSGNQPPVAAAQATPASGNGPLQVTLSATGSTDPGGLALAYAWDLDGDGQFDDASTSTATFTYSSPGLQTARVRVTNSAGLSDIAAASVLVSESYPSASILSPTGSLTWQVGDLVSFSGGGADPQDGTLPASAFSWDLLIHHCPQTCHAHPLQTFEGVKSGSFSPADHEYPSWMELRLTVTDSAGLQNSSSVLLYPKTVALTFASSPAGLQLTVGPTSQAAPFSRTVIVGSNNTVSAPAQGAYVFNSWSDGGGQTHTIVAPSSSSTYTATFSSSVPSNLVAAYGFNEGSGAVAGDASGNGRIGTVSGTSWNTAGRFGGALNFDGAASMVTVADAASLDLTTGMTLEAWVYPSSATGWRTAILKEAPNGLAYALYGNDGARPSAYVNQGAGDFEARSSSAIPLNTWTHLASTYDGSTLRLFVNGSQTAALAVTGAIRVSANPLRIGGNTVWGEYFQGRLDEIRIYNRALTAAEIQSDMNAPVAPPGPDTTSPTVAISTPAGGTTVAGLVTVTATATDNVAVTNVQFVLDGSSLGAPDSTAPFSIAWGSTTVGNGTHVLSAIARDAAGNQGTAAPVSVTVANDVAAPSVNITAPSAGNVLGTVTVRANASDDIGVTSVQFLLNGSNLGAADTASPFETSWNTLAVANGPYVITAVARDASGKQTTSAGVSVTVNNPPPPPDTTAPTVSLTAPAAGTLSGTVTVAATASDNVAVTSVQFQLNGANLGASDTAAPFTTSWNTTTSANGGPYLLTAIARDAAGNQTTSAAVSVQVSNVAATGLVAAYAFNEASGTSASDATGNNRTGTVSGAVWNAGGRFGGALSFDGVNDLVTVADASALDLTTGMTLSAWVRPTTLSGWRTAVLKESPGGLAYALYAHDDSPRPAAYLSVGGSDRTTPGASALPLNTWSYLSTTYDGASLRLFVNGTQVASQNVSGSVLVSTGALRIGGNTVWGEYFAGLIDEVRIYNRALSQAEIQVDMSSGVSAGQ